ncbi:MAG: 1-acyl-sn-glycerol-3-phosphate acyltransferase [Planctomycetes bacterium]|nr:1-acyl-sn-glycerol-3-phosphate acyltransferase [Planctomycetota bacterium]
MTLFRFRAYGLKNVPRSGGVILAANHQSYLDPALVGVGLDRDLHSMARTTLFRNPAFGALIATLNAFPVERDSGDVKGVKEALRRLKAGHALVMFPEGTRTRDGLVAPMKSGIRLLAERAAVPIVPVLVEGAYRVWPRMRALPEPGPVSVVYGPPVSAADGADFAARLREAVRSLHGTDHRRTQRSV